MAPKVDILSVEAIKPASATPPHLRTFQFSQWDLLIPPSYATFIFFYRSDFDSLPKFFNNSRLLKLALSKTLVHYYPLAGRLTDGHTAIECNDEGALFVEACSGDNLFSILNKPDANLLRHFIHPEVIDSISVPKLVLLVHLTLFSCGGMAVTIHIAHRFADAISVCTFLNSWITIIHGGEKSFKPMFLQSSSSPPENLSLPNLDQVDFSGEFVINRFVFSVSKIEAFKAKLSETKTEEPRNLPSNVNLVLAIIMKSVIAANRFVSGTSRPTALIQTVNMRKRVSPPFPDNTFGNILWIFQAVFEEDEIETSSLIRKIRSAIRRSNLTELEEKKKAETSEIRATETIKEMKNYYAAASLSKIPIYETDFGWGKPLWVVSSPSYQKNLIILMDTRDGDGIEAWICLDEKEMTIFQRQKEILAFAAVNPRVVVSHPRM